ncbi:MAG: DUF975 family protein [Polaribacter sp.]|nr:DUF975 family protein [Polaribacter sp.]
MKTENSTLMKMAKESLHGKWLLAIGTFVLYGIIVGAIAAMAEYSSIMSLVTLLIAGPFTLGVAIFSLAISRDEDARFEQIFAGFHNFGASLGAYLGAYLLMIVFTFLWTLLLIIPGIIAAISYAMTFYILADDESIGAMEAIDKSKEMMHGHKWDYFVLMLMYLGLGVLCLLTCGIGFFWLIPFVQVTNAKFYDDIKRIQ